MDNIQGQIAELYNSLAEEKPLRQQAEYRSQQAESCLAVIETQQHSSPAGQVSSLPQQPTQHGHDQFLTPKGPKVAAPDKFNGIPGGPAEIYASQVQLYMMAHPYLFPDNGSKVVFCLSYLTGGASSWAQPLITELFDAATASNITFQGFIDNSKAMYFNREKKAKSERALRALTQKGTVGSYTHDFNLDTVNTGWEVSTLISQFKQGLKHKIRVAMVMVQDEFTSIKQIANLASSPHSSTQPNP